MDEKKDEELHEEVDTSKEEVKETESKKSKELLGKVGEKSKKLSETVNDDEKSSKKKENALVTCRVLFISVLDKIYLICLILFFLVGTYSIFAGQISSLNYHFWARILEFIVFVICFVITYFFCNWFYKCVSKTMMCITKEQVYYEKYVPFVRWELTVPMNHVVAVNTYKFFWIFRALVIHRYHQIPIIFWTWNAQEFKDKYEEIAASATTKVNNQFESKNLINKEQFKFVYIFAGIIFVIIFMLGIVRLFAYVFSSERRISGAYTYKDETIELKKNGTCDLTLSGKDNVSDCTWTYDSESKSVSVVYKYETKTSWSNYQQNGSLSALYENKTLTYNGNKYEK